MAISDSGASESLLIYSNVFEKLAIFAVVVGLLILVISPFLHKRMHLDT
jgi:dipeptide/tripeptide permease